MEKIELKWYHKEDDMRKKFTVNGNPFSNYFPSIPDGVETSYEDAKKLASKGCTIETLAKECLKEQSVNIAVRRMVAVSTALLVISVSLNTKENYLTEFLRTYNKSKAQNLADFCKACGKRGVKSNSDSPESHNIGALIAIGEYSIALYLTNELRKAQEKAKVN